MVSTMCDTTFIGYNIFQNLHWMYSTIIITAIDSPEDRMADCSAFKSDVSLRSYNLRRLGEAVNDTVYKSTNTVIFIIIQSYVNNGTLSFS